MSLSISGDKETALPVFPAGSLKYFSRSKLGLKIHVTGIYATDHFPEKFSTGIATALIETSNFSVEVRVTTSCSMAHASQRPFLLQHHTLTVTARNRRSGSTTATTTLAATTTTALRIRHQYQPYRFRCWFCSACGHDVYLVNAMSPQFLLSRLRRCLLRGDVFSWQVYHGIG